MAKLQGKVIVVTGGTGVLAGAIIKSLAAGGAIVGILGRNSTIANARAKEILAAGGKAVPLIADVLIEDQLLTAKNEVIKNFGRIDGLVNGAGGNVAGAVVAPDSSVFELDIDSLREAFDLNLFGTILPTQIFGKAIAETSKSGSIINISSVTAKAAVTKVLGYSLAKTAIESYTKWFAVELANRYGQAIRMNAIVPGFFF